MFDTGLVSSGSSKSGNNLMTSSRPVPCKQGIEFALLSYGSDSC